MKAIRNSNYWLHVIVQAGAAIVFMWVVLFALDEVAVSRIIWAAGASTLASSAYIILCAPRAVVAKPVKVIGGYVLAIAVGLAMRFVAEYLCDLIPYCIVTDPTVHVFEVAAAISVGITLLCMVFLKLEHPPAAGLSVVMVLDIRNYAALLVILIAAIVLSILHVLFRRWLCDLVV